MLSHWRHFFLNLLPFHQKTRLRKAYNFWRLPLWTSKKRFFISSAQMGAVWGEGALPLCTDGNCVSSLPPTLSRLLSVSRWPISLPPSPTCQANEHSRPPLTSQFLCSPVMSAPWERPLLLHQPHQAFKNMIIFSLSFYSVLYMHDAGEAFSEHLVCHTPWTGSWWFLKKNLSNSHFVGNCEINHTPSTVGHLCS